MAPEAGAAGEQPASRPPGSGRGGRRRWADLVGRRLLVRGTTFILRMLFRLHGGYRVLGLENVPRKGAALISPNHMSWADSPAVLSALGRPVWFMANDDLFRVRVLGRLVPYYGAFPVERGRVDREALRVAEQHLKDGDLVCLFPEGGTSETGRLSPFEGGVAMLAIRNNVPIVPVAITGTEKVMPSTPAGPGRPRYAKGGVTVRFGAPLHPGDLDPGLPRREQIRVFTERLHAAVAALLPPEYLPE